mmetsp:Transcript_23889/g.68783  ORF Transcript_23889/g.68783 Transcript_23889/m.68783 type:complete len:154 (-) Transcript_23889:329-790(-)
MNIHSFRFCRFPEYLHGIFISFCLVFLVSENPEHVSVMISLCFDGICVLQTNPNPLCDRNGKLNELWGCLLMACCKSGTCTKSMGKRTGIRASFCVKFIQQTSSLQWSLLVCTIGQGTEHLIPMDHRWLQLQPTRILHTFHDCMANLRHFLRS